MSYPDWVPMWLRTAMGRKCEDLAALAVPVTMKFPDGRASNVETAELTMATFGPIAWRLPDGCGDPRGVVSLVRVSPDVLVDFVACKHRPNARAVLFQKSADSELAVSAASFDAQCMDAIVAQYPRTRWSLQLIYQYLCAFDGEPAEDLGNLVAIVRSHGKHFEVKSKKRAEPTGIDLSALPMMYDVSCLAKPPTLQATWLGPMAEFKFVHPGYVPEDDATFLVAGTKWRAADSPHRRGVDWVLAHLAADGDPRLGEDRNYSVKTVEGAIAIVADAFDFSRRRSVADVKDWAAVSTVDGVVGLSKPIEAPGTVSPAERDAKMAPPSIMVSLPKAKPGESLMLKWSAEAGALLTNANGESVGSVERVPSTLCARDGAKANDAPLPELGPEDISEWRILGSAKMMLRVHRYPTLQPTSIWTPNHNLSVCGVGVVATQVTAMSGAAIGIHIDLETSGEALRRALAPTSYAEMNLDSAHALEAVICSAKQPGQRFHEVRVVKDWTRVERP